MQLEFETTAARARSTRGARRLAALAVALSLAACTSAPEVKRAIAIGNADTVEVALWSGSTGTRLMLRNPGASVRAAAARAKPSATSIRDLDGDQMQKFLDALATYKFFELAATPQGSRSKSTLTVEVNGRQYVASGAQPTAERLQNWTDCIAIFQDVYNRTSEYEVRELDSAERRRVLEEFQRHSGEPRKEPAR